MICWWAYGFCHQSDPNKKFYSLNKCGWWPLPCVFVEPVQWLFCSDRDMIPHWLPSLPISSVGKHKPAGGIATCDQARTPTALWWLCGWNNAFTAHEVRFSDTFIIASIVRLWCTLPMWKNITSVLNKMVPTVYVFGAVMIWNESRSVR